MTSKTFPGFVSTGRLQFEGSLAPFEGRQVLVTVIAPDPAFVPNVRDQSRSDEPPAELDVETEIFAPVPPVSERLGPVEIRDAGPAPACIILPEDMPDA
ncbi:MAG: hypothetical protein L0Z62_16135 [Gemmataceae bacterium]|nr:hypothetical protein [Gemmataceae bacterium]